MSDRISAWIHAITGRLSQVPTGECPYVGLVPDDYLPPEQDIGTFAISVPAGGAGLRSEAVIVLTSLRLTEGLEISNLYVQVGTASNVEIVVPSALAGYTTTALNASDLGYLKSRAAILSKNTAVAAVNDRVITNTIFLATAGIYQPVPGKFILRKMNNAGAPETEAILIRSDTDNVAIRVLGTWRALDKRSL